MTVGYELVNVSRRERISFAHLPVSSAREIAGNPVAAAIVAWYMLRHAGDRVAFVSDSHDEWPLPGRREDLATFEDVTDRVIEKLVAEGIAADDGLDYPIEGDRSVYLRRLRNRWADDSPHCSPVPAPVRCTLIPLPFSLNDPCRNFAFHRAGDALIIDFQDWRAIEHRVTFSPTYLFRFGVIPPYLGVPEATLVEVPESEQVRLLHECCVVEREEALREFVLSTNEDEWCQVVATSFTLEQA